MKNLQCEKVISGPWNTTSQVGMGSPQVPLKNGCHIMGSRQWNKKHFGNNVLRTMKLKDKLDNLDGGSSLDEGHVLLWLMSCARKEKY